MGKPPAPSAGMVRRSSGEQAALYIRRLIFAGTLRPGTRVPQDQIAQQLGISRIPVREALISLEREGWVTIELHRGAFINAIDEATVRDHYELYGIVYGFVARRALARDVTDLADRLAEMAKGVPAIDDPVEMGRVTDAFHAAILDAARSPRVRAVLRSMPTLVPGHFFTLVPGAMEIEKRSIPTIVRAVRRGDADRLCEEYLRMTRRIGGKVVDLFRERGLFDPSGFAA